MNNRIIKSAFSLLLAAGVITLAACTNTNEAPATTTAYAVTDITEIPEDIADITVNAETIENTDSTIVQTEAVYAKQDVDITEVTTTAYETLQEEYATTMTTTSMIKYEEAPLVPTMNFDEVNDCLMGKTYCVGRTGVLFTVDSIETDNSTGFITVEYTLEVDGTKYTGKGGRFADGIISQFVQDEYSPNVVSLYWCDDTENLSYASVIITSDIYPPDPLILSGNHDDICEITYPEYVETDDMILFLSEGTVIRGDTMDNLYKLIDILEKESGLEFFNNSEYAHLRSNKHVGEFADVFADVDYRMQKFHVYVVPYEVSPPCAWNAEVVINPEDIDFDTDCSALIHEFAHAIHLRNGVGLGRIMTEGYAAYMTDRILEKYPQLNSDFDAESSYSGFFTKLTPANAEKSFTEVQDDEFNYYLYGYRFLNFLYDEYGDGIFNEILKTANENAALYEFDLIENEKAVPYIKKCTSNKVFSEFAVWLAENEDMFDGN